MEGGDSKFADFTLPTLKTFWRPVVRMCLATSNNLLLVLQDAPKLIFSPTNSRSSCQPKNNARTLFSTLQLLPLVIFANAAVVAFLLLRISSFNFHCYTQREATPTQKSARKCRCDLSRLLARKITKGIHSCEPASLNRPLYDTAGRLANKASNIVARNSEDLKC